MFILRRVLLGFSSLILLFFTLALLLTMVVNFTDWNRHLSFVAANLERVSDWKVLKWGGLDIHIGSVSHFKVHDLHLEQGEKNKAQSQVKVGSFAFEARLWPYLLRNRMIVENVSLAHARFSIQPASQDVAAEGFGPLAWIEDRLQGTPAFFLRNARIENLELLYRPSAAANEWQGGIEQLTIHSDSHDQPARLQAKGNLWALPFQIEGELASYQRFLDFDSDFPLQIESDIAGQKIKIRGVFAFAIKKARFLLEAEGSQVAEVWKPYFAPLEPGKVPPYRIKATIDKSLGRFSFEGVDITLGKTHLFGDVELDLERARPYLQADLGASLVRYKDLAFLRAQKDAEESQVFSREQFSPDALQGLDMDLKLAIAAYKGEDPYRILDRAWVRIKLDRGLLNVDPMDIGLAAGTLNGKMTVDARTLPLHASLQLDLKNLDLASFLTPYLDAIPLADENITELLKGKMLASFDLSAKGQSPHELARALVGKIQIAFQEASLTPSLIEGFGFEPKLARAASFAGQTTGDLRCMLASFTAKSGTIDTDVLLLGTAQANMMGGGSTDLERESVDYKFEKRARDFSLGAGGSPLRVYGPFKEVLVEVEKKGQALQSGASVVLSSLVNPLQSLLPLIESGLGRDGRCARYIGEISSLDPKVNQKIN